MGGGVRSGGRRRLSRPLWDKLTGKIDHEVADYMRDHGYDLRDYAAKNWSKIGPKLTDKVFIWVGDMDNFYLNLAVYDMEDFFKLHPEAKAHFEYGRPEKGHGWFPWQPVDFIRKMASQIAEHAPAGSDARAGSIDEGRAAPKINPASSRPVKRSVDMAKLQLTFLLAFLLALPVPFLAQVSNESALTNADIARMVKAGVPESIIVREIQMSRTDFGTSPAALIELRKQGASEAVLGAVLDSRMGAGRVREPLAAPHVPAQSAAPGPHHLPTFEAKMKLNATTNGKLSMSHNQIKVERSGVPLFTLKWKEPKIK